MAASLAPGGSNAASHSPRTSSIPDTPAPALSDHLLTPASISSVEVYGATNTRKSLLDHLFRPLVENPGPTTTLGELLNRINRASEKLVRLDIFKQEGYGVFISDARDRPSGAAGLHPERTELDVSFRVKEKSRLVLSAGTDFGNAEGSAYTNAVLRNVFGGAESLSVNASTGTRTRSAYNAVFSAPLNGNPDLRVGVEGLRSSTQKPWASHEEQLAGGSLRLAWLAGKMGDSHALAYSGVWRQLTGLAAGASPTVRADAGDSLKSSITHTFTRDRRDSPTLPQRGHLFRTVSELAGWGPLHGDVSFFKSEAEVAGASSLLSTARFHKSGTPITVGGSLRLGLLYPLAAGFSFGGPALPSRINDRFQLGGPTDVRGFKLGGLGPHDGSDAVGGDVFAAGSVNMMLPLPRTGPASPLRIQLFANGGRLVALRNEGRENENGGPDSNLALDSSAVLRGMKSAVGELASELPSLAAGVGLVYAHPVARFELNFSLPIIRREGEQVRKGLQDIHHE
ncbi:surface antigen-domain-containing protein [Lasiosphaeria miniovina]|uniref:Surface antigen-domain-containing protein n=1 Tax=Lasiosphaeria miniovina TaxID=1954250 RepID=A0AA40A4M7_9PEZI|nr:surface antigen-domain-containing protein [Lasiosphaeria miniovina]KAK0709209.1 surface antigen-domain-containing protein [Lasiosphaeria miniovina]